MKKNRKPRKIRPIPSTFFRIAKNAEFEYDGEVFLKIGVKKALDSKGRIAPFADNTLVKPKLIKN